MSARRETTGKNRDDQQHMSVMNGAIKSVPNSPAKQSLRGSKQQSEATGATTTISGSAKQDVDGKSTAQLQSPRGDDAPFFMEED